MPPESVDTQEDTQEHQDDPGDYRARIARAQRRIRQAENERAAGQLDIDRAIADEVARRGRGGARQLAQERGVSEKTISLAVARGKAAGRQPTLPFDTLELLLTAERDHLAPLTMQQWLILGQLLRGQIIDASWIQGNPGDRLAGEVEDAFGLSDEDRETLITACRTWTPMQTLAVIDACQHEAEHLLPTVEE